MQKAILVLNAGSSSLKFAIYTIASHLQCIHYGEFAALKEQALFIVKNSRGEFLEQIQLNSENFKINPYAAALEYLLTWIQTKQNSYTISAVGHRIVHGGDIFVKPTIVTADVIKQLKSIIPLDPLHLPYNLAGLEYIAEKFPELTQVSCFDTAFHTTQSVLTTTYALPPNIAPMTIKRYGFHGLSYQYIASVLPNYLDAPFANGKTIVAHLGSGASLCAMNNRQSVATSMGFSALDGIPMSTRCGSLDPGVLLYLLKQNMTLDQLSELLYKQSGLLGVSGISSDVRVLLQSTDSKAALALEMFCYRTHREIGSLAAALNGLDTLVFTAGIGEHSSVIRAKICVYAKWLGVILDDRANETHQQKISAETSRVGVWVIPTNEELVIAESTYQLYQTTIGSEH